ncbi:hypothetical protein EVAR_17574_1 [Eumeta japonica]|uniref:Uncharacterized protein n=1 Tax=Eumeta variegata TaxID=151549 RepID=A0A4C1UCU1_EUMVA|nr:hypothetical protein EVAR_17574_1 [Eumeta japonica]
MQLLRQQRKVGKLLLINVNIRCFLSAIDPVYENQVRLYLYVRDHTNRVLKIGNCKQNQDLYARVHPPYASESRDRLQTDAGRNLYIFIFIYGRNVELGSEGLGLELKARVTWKEREIGIGIEGKSGMESERRFGIGIEGKGKGKGKRKEEEGGRWMEEGKSGWKWWKGKEREWNRNKSGIEKERGIRLE